jgi:ssDNA-binding Zn-finger/Zn-ribbon topoisomerase 1
VVQAIRSEAVTGDPELKPTEIDFACRHCGAPVEVRYSRGKARYSCRECGGNVGRSDSRYGGEWDDEVTPGNLGNETLPPAGIKGRTAEEIFRASGTWAHLDALSAAGDVCPRCAAPVARSVRVCEDHDSTDGHCDRCDSRRAVVVHFDCTNCIYRANYAAIMALLDDPRLLSFVGEHGLNTTTDGIEWGWDYGEEIRSTDPFEARFTVTIDGDAIALTVGEDLNVVDVSR